MNNVTFWSRPHWNLLSMVQSIMSQHWFRYWLVMNLLQAVISANANVLSIDPREILNQNTKHFLYENIFENTVCQMKAISSVLSLLNSVATSTVLYKFMFNVMSLIAHFQWNVYTFDISPPRNIRNLCNSILWLPHNIVRQITTQYCKNH